MLCYFQKVALKTSRYQNTVSEPWNDGRNTFGNDGLQPSEARSTGMLLVCSAWSNQSTWVYHHSESALFRRLFFELVNQWMIMVCTLAIHFKMWIGSKLDFDHLQNASTDLDFMFMADFFSRVSFNGFVAREYWRIAMKDSPNPTGIVCSEWCGLRAETQAVPTTFGADFGMLRELFVFCFIWHSYCIKKWCQDGMMFSRQMSLLHIFGDDVTVFCQAVALFKPLFMHFLFSAGSSSTRGSGVTRRAARYKW